ncbi:MAG: helix-turn-helix domain-containing protein [Firmicutes bacterium]|nr:helix-turn-helix domain-containing protein [Bacillota bacterium]
MSSEDILKKIKDELKTNKVKKDEDYKKKLMLARDILENKNFKESYIKYNMSKSTAYRIRKKFLRNYDTEVLLKKQGRPLVLNEEQQLHLIEVLKKKPYHFGYNNFYWNGRNISHYIKKKYDIYITEQTGRSYLKKINCYLKKAKK